MSGVQPHVCALLDPAADRVLVGPADPPRLPVLHADWPGPAELAQAVGAPSAWPASPPFRQDDGAVIDVLVARRPDPADGRRWWPLARVADLGLEPAAAAALVTAARELRDGVPDDGRAQWWRPGWADEVDAWVDEALAVRGGRRLGPGQPVKVWSLSAVVSHPVAGADGRPARWWSKAPGAGFRAEPAITAWLAATVPWLVPGLVAHDPERAWLLLEEVELAEDLPPDVAPGHLAAVARAHAAAQLATLTSLDGLRAAGAPDRGPAATLTDLWRVLAGSPALTWLTDRVAELHGLGLPLALVHGDLHLWNVGRVAGRPVVFDWTDGCLAHPYLDGAHLATSAEQSHGPAAADVVRREFLGVWAAAFPGVDHARAWALAGIVDRVFTLLSYDAIGRALRPADRWEHAGTAAALRASVESLAP